MIDEDNLHIFIRKRITTLRQNAGYTINGLAYKSGVSQSYIRDIELGNKTNISVEKLFMLCLELNISLSDFFNEDFIVAEPTPLENRINGMRPNQQDTLLHFLNTVD